MDETVLLRHVGLFNQGVRTGDFGPMLEPFDDDAELIFVGVPVGPFRGKDEIARAYRAQPPDDEIVISDVGADGDELVTRYEWRRGGSGELRLAVRDGRIARLVVTFD